MNKRIRSCPAMETMGVQSVTRPIVSTLETAATSQGFPATNSAYRFA